jgi:hypothetical protein
VVNTLQQELDYDSEIWLEVCVLWRILRYQSPGSQRAKMKAAVHLKDFVNSKITQAIADGLPGESRPPVKRERE